MGLNSCACVPPDGDDWSGPWLGECDYHREQRLALAKSIANVARERGLIVRYIRRRARAKSAGVDTRPVAEVLNVLAADIANQEYRRK